MADTVERQGSPMVIVRVGKQPGMLLSPYGLVEFNTCAPNTGVLAQNPQELLSVEVTVLGQPTPAMLLLQGDRQGVTVDWGDGPWEVEQAHIQLRADRLTTT